jgi:hypothetical protein
MNHFERIAIFTVVENIESQLRGLKTLIAASSSAQGPSPSTHKTTPTLDTDSHELSDEDEEKLHRELELARTTEIARMRKEAEGHFQKEWEKTAQVMSDLDG